VDVQLENKDNCSMQEGRMTSVIMHIMGTYKCGRHDPFFQKSGIVKGGNTPLRESDKATLNICERLRIHW
jgi:hypothetical protein